MGKPRPKFERACEFIALEDNPGDNPPIEDLAGTIIVALVADTWGCTPLEVATRVWSMRNNENDAYFVGRN